MNASYTAYYHSPVGMIRITSDLQYITEVHFLSDSPQPNSPINQLPDSPKVLDQCVTQLMEYFNGGRKNFDLPIHQEGTSFQQRVWSELLTIPYGKTISYIQLSKQLGDPKAIRAAASTNGKNKIAILVPCHRVIGKKGDLVGYAAGLPRKKWLLQHEAKHTYGIQTLF
jgi:methylated-DNA-[protein]-cysteine S-methyltransferase